jgi:cytoskeletal protein CcmA (bactofilin family)
VNKLPKLAVLEGRVAPDMVSVGTVPDGASNTHFSEKGEVDMLNSLKSGAPEKDKSADNVNLRAVQPHDRAMTKSGAASCIGSDMSIVGNIECDGPAQVFGQIQGELRASDLLIGDGARVEGSVIAQDVTVCGRVKGTIRAVSVKLQDGGAVEGDIFHRSLSIDENSLFEGSSRRVENSTDPSSVGAKGPQKQDMPSSALAPYLQRVEESASTEWSDSAVEPKH